MKRTALMLLLLTISLVAFAQSTPAAKPAQASSAPPDFATVLSRQLANLENELVPAADAMPDDKITYQTTKDTMPFIKQVAHAAATNYFYCSAILGEKPPVDLGPDGDGPNFKTKAEAVKYMKDSFEYARKAFGSINAQNAVAPLSLPGGRTGTRLGLAFNTVAHGNNHYGQMVQYLRLNGVVPPASRPRSQ